MSSSRCYMKRKCKRLNKKPVSYMQTDARWKNTRLNCIGGTMSIGGGGCGPTSAAMLIETLTGKTCLPTETFKWACDNGYVYANQGTAYECFKPMFKKYGLNCDILTWTQCMSATSPVRKQVIQKLQEGYYFIALMKKGLWTSGGHFIVVWWADDKIRINDPASTRTERLNGDPDTFFSQAKYFWWVDARKYNKGDELDITKAEFLKSLTAEEKAQLVLDANDYLGTLSAPDWAKEELAEAKRLGITDGTRPMQLIPRYQAAIMAKRAMQK